MKCFWNVVDDKIISGKVLCECICGVRKMVNTNNLKLGKTNSCGCKGTGIIPKDVRRTYTLMKYRCETKTSPDYANWGGKGIKVLYSNVFEFYKDVGDKPSDKHSIDRIDHSKHYSKGNCRWATTKEQANNRSSNHFVCFQGENITVSEFAEILGMKYSTVNERLKRNWSTDMIANTAIDKNKSKAGRARHGL